MKTKRGPNKTDKYIGEKIREARKAQGLCLQDVALKIGVSWQQVCKYEIAQNRVSASTLYEIAKFFNLKITYFLPERK